MSSAEIIASLTPTRRAAAVIASSSIAAAAGNGSRDLHGSAGTNSSSHHQNGERSSSSGFSLSSSRGSSHRDDHGHHHHRHRSKSPTGSAGRRSSSTSSLAFGSPFASAFAAAPASSRSSGGHDKREFNFDPNELTLSDGLALGLVQLSRPLWKEDEEEDGDEDDDSFYEDEDFNNDEATLISASQSRKLSSRVTPPLLQTVLRILRTMRNEQRRIDRLLQCVGDKLGISVADLKLLHHLEHDAVDSLWAVGNPATDSELEELLAASFGALGTLPPAAPATATSDQPSIQMTDDTDHSASALPVADQFPPSGSVAENDSAESSLNIHNHNNTNNNNMPTSSLDNVSHEDVSLQEHEASVSHPDDLSTTILLDDESISANDSQMLDITDPLSPPPPLSLNDEAADSKPALLSKSFAFTGIPDAPTDGRKLVYTPNWRLRRRIRAKRRLTRRRKLLKDIFSGIPLHNYFSEEEDEYYDDDDDDDEDEDDDDDDDDPIDRHRSKSFLENNKTKKKKTLSSSPFTTDKNQEKSRQEDLQIRRLKPDSFDQLLQTFPRRRGLISQEPKDCMDNVFSALSSLPEELNRNLQAVKSLFLPNLMAAQKPSSNR